MKLKLPLFAYGGYSHFVSQQLPKLIDQLKEAPYKLPRRADRLTQLSLLGLSNTPGCDQLKTDTHLVLASGDANLSSTISNNEQIFASGTIPNPIGFLNTVNNATAYHICVTLGIQGQAITVSRDHCSLEAGIQIAATLQHSSPVPILLGTVDEVPKDPEQHRLRLNLNQQAPLAEGSFWFHCGHPQHAEPPLALILHCGAKSGFNDVIDFFREHRITHHLLGDKILNSELGGLDQLPGKRVTPTSQGHYLTQNAYYLQYWLASARQGDRLGMLNSTAGSHRLSVTLIEKQ
jgi:hypothetical protein